MKEIPGIRPRSSRSVRKMLNKIERIHRRGSSSSSDIKAREAAAIERDAAIHRYHDLYDLAPIGFYNLDWVARITELNEKGAGLLGFPGKWLLGKPFVVFIARQDVQRFIDLIKECTQTREPKTVELDMHVANRTQPVQISMKTSGRGHELVHRIIVVDLTDSRKTEGLLQESLANWSSLVHNAPDTIMTVEAGGRISFVNRPIWGYSVKALVGSNILDYVPESDHRQVLRCMEQAFKYNKKSACESTGIGGDWASWFSFSFGSPHPSALPSLGITKTRTTTTTVMIREISEHKRTEETLRVSGERMRDFAARLEAVREEERTRVAREIHDELGQALTALKLDLSWVSSKTRGTAEIRKKMQSMMAHVDDTIECVRRIASELRPSILDDLGLIPAIEWQVSQFRKRTGIRTELVTNADGLRVTAEASAAVFRVVQEALTNIIRHAEANRVHISLNLIRRALKISIADNGRGMPRSQETYLKSLGIVGMKERIARLGGQFNIFSEPGKGTRLDIVIPAQND
jgi:signal transduction histidine kinase